MDTQLEEVARAIELVLRASLPDALVAVAADMESADAAYYQALGEQVQETPLAEPLEWHLGSRPAMVDREDVKFPTVAITAFQHRAGRIGVDQIEGMATGASVEAWVVANDSRTCNRIAWRYGKALHRCIIANPTLNGLVLSVSETPNMDLSGSTSKPRSRDDNTLVYRQGVLLTYTYVVPQEWAT